MSSKSEIESLLKTKEYKAVSDTINSSIQKTQDTSAWQEAALAEAYLSQNELGLSIIHQQRAVLLHRSNFELRDNLKYLQSQVENQNGLRMSHPADFGFEVSSWIRSKESVSIAFFLLNAFLLLRFFKKPNIKRDLALGSVTVLFILISALSYYGEGVGVIPNKSVLRQKPLEVSDIVKELPAGTRLRKLRSSGAFAEVERSEPNPTRGWIKQSELILFY